MKNLVTVCLIVGLTSYFNSVAATPFLAPILEGVMGGIVETVTGHILDGRDDTQKYKEQLEKIEALLKEIADSPKQDQSDKATLEKVRKILLQLQKNDSPEARSQALEKLSALMSPEQQAEMLKKQTLQFDIEYSYRKKGEGELLPLKQGAILHSGDTFKIVFTPKQDAYVYIFQIDSNEQLSRLFPNQQYGETPLSQPNHYLRAGRTYHAPEEKNKSFQLDSKTGLEKIYFIATTEADPELEKLNQSTLAEAKPILLRRGRGISAIVNDLQSTEVDNEQVTQLVKSKLLGECGNDCVSVLTFKHQ